MANTSSEAPRSWITEGLIVAATPAAAYLLSFVYEAAFAKTFDIPFGLISLSMTSVFIIAISLAIAVSPVLFIANYLWMFVPSHMGPIARRFFVVALFLLMVLPFVLIHGLSDWRGWIGSAIVPVTAGILAILDFVWPLLSQRGKRSYREKLEADEEAERSVVSLLGLVFRRLGPPVAVTFALFSLALLVAYDKGQTDARRQERFVVLKNEPPLVVLRMYGDNWVVASLDRDTRTVDRALSVVSASSSGVRFEFEEIGPLRLKGVSLPAR